MHIETRPRQGGKTTACIDWLFADLENRVIICATRAHKNALVDYCMRRARDVQLDQPAFRPYFDNRVFSVMEFRNDEIRRGNALHLRTIGVDDIDEVIAQMLGLPRPEFGTLTGEFHPYHPHALAEEAVD